MWDKEIPRKPWHEVTFASAGNNFLKVQDYKYSSKINPDSCPKS